MVIFGAGASYDSIDATRIPSELTMKRPQRQRRRELVRNYRPPLASELFAPRPSFDQIIAGYPSVAIRAKELRTLPETANLEEEQDHLRGLSNADSTARRDLAGIRYYLKRVLWECGDEWFRFSPRETNYDLLLRKLRQWREDKGEVISLVTFNYELLLERAIRASIGGVNLGTIEGYVAHPSYKVLRPHGAVHWAHHVSAPIRVDVKRDPLEIELDVIDLFGE